MKDAYVPRPMLWLIVGLLLFLVLRPAFSPEVKAAAESARFDHIYVVAPLFLHKGQQGLLLMDKRNGNVWFMAKQADELNLKYGEPVLLTRIPLEKLDQAP